MKEDLGDVKNDLRAARNEAIMEQKGSYSTRDLITIMWIPLLVTMT